MANPGRNRPIKLVPGYAATVTTPPEPTNADLLAFMTEFSGHVMAEFAKVHADTEELKTGQAQLRADVAELKVEFSLMEARLDDAHRAILRHGNNPNAHAA